MNVKYVVLLMLRNESEVKKRVNFMGHTFRLVCSQLLLGFDIRLISVFGKAEFKLIVMCNLHLVA